MFNPDLKKTVHVRGTEQHSRNGNRRLWQVAFISFLLAALTGVLYRFGITGWLPWDVNLQNLRHAHSHLMLFGWAVPLPFLICLHQAERSVSGKNKALKMMRWSIRGGLIFGLLSWLFFLVYGYHSVSFGAVSLPLSVMLSGLVMLTWYGFMVGYMVVRSAMEHMSATVWYDMALLMLFISSLGAWGVSVLQLAEVQNQLFTTAMTHFFLSVFTEGWVVLALLAILIQALKVEEEDLLFSSGILSVVILTGACLTFPYGISKVLLTPELIGAARFGGLLVSAGLVLTLYSLVKKSERGSVWIWPLGLLFLKALMQLGASVVPAAFWLSDHALRIFYLHLLLLGALTLCGSAWLHQVNHRMPKIHFLSVSFSVVVVLFSLLMLIDLWPFALKGLWVYHFAGYVSVLPVIVVAIYWFKLEKVEGDRDNTLPETTTMNRR